MEERAQQQIAWFMCLAIFSTVGILPIIYVVWCQKDRNVAASRQSAAL